MRKISLFLITAFATTTVFPQSLAVNTDGSTANSSSILHVKSTDKGVLIPRMSKAEKNAIVSPAEGLLIYQGTPDSVGFYYYKSGNWTLISDAAANAAWLPTGNTGTNAATNYIGTTDLEDLVFKTNNTETMRIDSIGKVGIGTATPAHKLQVNGDMRIIGDFINQDAVGASSGSVQNVPFTNLAFSPLTGTETSITIADGNGVDNSAVFIGGFARIFGGNLTGASSSLGGYFLVLEKDISPTFATATIVTYTSGVCYIETPNAASSHVLGFGGGGHISFLESNLVPGTYYYRLTLVPNSTGITAGTFDVYQRSLTVLQIKR